MGLGDFFNGLGNSFKQGISKIGGVFNGGFNEVKKFGQSAYKVASNIVGGAIQETNHLIDGVENTIKFAIDRGTGVANNAIHTAGTSLVGVSSNLSLPLLLLGAAVGGVFLLKANK